MRCLRSGPRCLAGPAAGALQKQHTMQPLNSALAARYCPVALGYCRAASQQLGRRHDRLPPAGRTHSCSLSEPFPPATPFFFGLLLVRAQGQWMGKQRGGGAMVISRKKRARSGAPGPSRPPSPLSPAALDRLGQQGDHGFCQGLGAAVQPVHQSQHEQRCANTCRGQP